MRGITKKDYIEATYEIMETEGISAVSIRNIAKKLNCNSALLYKNFESLDELIIYASVRVLREYISDMKSQKFNNSLEQLFVVWECFAKHSFRHIHIFDNLFFGKYSNMLDKIIRDYYRIFREDFCEIEEYMRLVLTQGDFGIREQLMILKCVEEGIIRAKDARVLCLLNVNLYKGFLKGLLDLDEEQYKKTNIDYAVSEFMFCLKDMIMHYTIE